MPDTEVLAWTKANGRFEDARAAVNAVTESIDKVCRALNDWSTLFPSGMRFRRFDAKQTGTFDASVWPDAAHITKVLTECHQAYDALLAAYGPLAPEDRKRLNLSAAPKP